jgi:protein gp37
MGQTAISWTATVLSDGTTLPGYTFNPWIGCTKVSEGCRLCYAETQNKRYGWTSGWGKGAPRKRTSAANWKKPLEWAKQAVKDRVTRRVFCASLADVFDPEVDQDWRDDLLELMYEASETIGGLEWLVLTKRPENISEMLNYHLLAIAPDWLRIGVTVEHQNQIDRYATLAKAWRGKNFVSYEPALGPLQIIFATYSLEIDWVICGGESGAGCRPMDLNWARDARDQCQIAGVPFFFKQIGGFPNKRDDPAEWPEDLRVQEFPVVHSAG